MAQCGGGPTFDRSRLPPTTRNGGQRSEKPAKLGGGGGGGGAAWNYVCRQQRRRRRLALAYLRATSVSDAGRGGGNGARGREGMRDVIGVRPSGISRLAGLPASTMG